MINKLGGGHVPATVVQCLDPVLDQNDRGVARHIFMWKHNSNWASIFQSKM